MLEQLLGEILSLIGQGVAFYLVFGAVLWTLLWLLHVFSPPVDRLDRWLKSTAPQRTYTRADHLRGYAIAVVTFCLIALALHQSAFLGAPP